jgi:hypothetical protein
LIPLELLSVLASEDYQFLDRFEEATNYSTQLNPPDLNNDVTAELREEDDRTESPPSSEDFTEVFDNQSSDEHTSQTAVVLPDESNDGLIMAQAWTYTEGSLDLDDYNPSSRDTAAFPGDLDDRGNVQMIGETIFILVTSYDETKETSGSVWAIPHDNPGAPSVVVTGLHKPTGVCFDTTHDFLYVTDIGFIYQYEIDWDSDSKFQLAKDEYTVVYEGSEPYDCAVDEYSNLYLVDRYLSQVSIINYIDLWAGFKNQHTVMYDADSKAVNLPAGLDFADSSSIFFTNSQTTQTASAVVSAESRVEYRNQAQTYAVQTDLSGAVGVGASEDFVFFTGVEGSLNVYNIQQETVSTKASGGSLVGVCYGDGKVYSADSSSSKVLQFSADSSEEQGTDLLIISAPYGLHCINWGQVVGLAMLSLLA